MNKQILIEQLQHFGLNETEASVYLYLLENGPQTPLQISRNINIDRSKIYRCVEALHKQSFLEESHAAWGKQLRAASPKNIELRVIKQEEDLKKHKAVLPSLIDSLSQMPNHAKREFEVKHYRGQDGLKQMLWNQLSAKDEILAFSFKNKNDIAGKTYAEKVRYTQAERKIPLREIENETDQGDYWYTDVKEWQKYYKSRYISPEILSIKQYMAIYNNTVSVINWIDGEEVGLEIENQTYSEMQKQIFEQFWQIAEKPTK